MNLKLNILALVLFAMFLPIHAATKPVTAIITLSPPYTPFLNEYGTAGANKLQVTFIVNDSRMINHPVKLQMLLEKVGAGVVMRTSDYAAIPPIFLNGNTTEMFTGADLAAYFLPQNMLAGAVQQQYLQTGRIPDGQYRLGFQVVDAQRPEVVISNTAYTQPAWFLLNDPPLLNLPRNKENVRIDEIQNLRFEWFPRHLGSMNAAFATNYQLEIFALRVQGIDPNMVTLALPPDYTATTTATNFVLTADKFLLEPGVEYAFRVRATAGGSDLTLFKNNGYSEVYSFVYGSLCPQPTNVKHANTGQEQVKLTWDSNQQQTGYELRFRKKGDANGTWNTRQTYSNDLEISNVLQASTTYEYQLFANCNTTKSGYTPLAYFTTAAPILTKFECGSGSDETSVTNFTPKSFLQVGDMIYSGKFPVKITEVTGSNGTFSGIGLMRIPFLNNVQVRMKFTNINVNELNQIFGDGELVSVYDANSRFYQHIEENEISTVKTDTVKTNPVISENTKTTNNDSTSLLTVTGKDRKEQIVSVEKNDSTTASTVIVESENKKSDTNDSTTTGNQAGNLAENNADNNNSDAETKKEEKEFKLVELRAIDKKKEKRVAKAGEILYYVDMPTLKDEERNTQFEITINPNLKTTEIEKDRIQWTYSTKRLTTDDGKIKIEKSIVENDDAKVSVKAGYPSTNTKTVDVKWVDGYDVNTDLVEKFNKIIVFLQEFNNISKKFGKVISCEASVLRDFNALRQQKRVSLNMRLYNKENDDDREICSIKEVTVKLNSADLATLKCSKSIGIGPISLGNAFISGNLGADIDFKYRLNISNETKKATSNGDVSGGLKLTFKGGLETNPEFAEYIYATANLNVSVGTKTIWPYKNDDSKVGSYFYVGNTNLTLQGYVDCWLTGGREDFNFSLVVFESKWESSTRLIFDLKNGEIYTEDNNNN